MKKLLTSLFVLLSPFLLFSQKKFRIEITAPSLIHDSLLFGPSWVVPKGWLAEVYRFRVNTDKNITDFGKGRGFEQCVYTVAVQQNNMLEGEFDYPIPVSFQFYDQNTSRAYVSSTFFLDSGYYKSGFSKTQNYNVNMVSPVNNEYEKFKKLFSDLYTHVDGHVLDSLTNLAEKEKRVGAYIKKNPDSYVALWEILNDYIRHDYYPVYLENLQLFSNTVKNSRLFLNFENRLRLDSASNKGNRFELEKTIVAGKEFPAIKFDERNTLTKQDFQKYKLTFIDCWATSCGHCIKAMPDMVKMYNKYKNKGINFIIVTDEQEAERIERAKEILKKNNVKWTNYFDINNDFSNKVGLPTYPTQFLVDQNGRIVIRVEGDLDSIRKTIDNYLMSQKNE